MNIPNVVSYCFDRQTQEWCEVSFRVNIKFQLSSAASNSYIDIKHLFLCSFLY